MAMLKVIFCLNFLFVSVVAPGAPMILNEVNIDEQYIELKNLDLGQQSLDDKKLVIVLQNEGLTDHSEAKLSGSVPPNEVLRVNTNGSPGGARRRKRDLTVSLNFPTDQNAIIMIRGKIIISLIEIVNCFFL